MDNTITIKGVAKATVKPDWVVMSLSVEGAAKMYCEAVDLADDKISKLTHNLELIGLDKKSIKTTRYNVVPQYNFINDKKGRVKKEFKGYLCSHKVDIEFDFASEMVGKVLGAVEISFANPQLDIAFTLKDKEAVSDMLLMEATKNAKRKAEIVCKAADVKLGKLVNVSYNWNEINVFTRPAFNQGDTFGNIYEPSEIKDIMAPKTDIQPDDISVSDFATFVWEIV